MRRIFVFTFKIFLIVSICAFLHLMTTLDSDLLPLFSETRFAKLQPYFDGVTLGDLHILTEEDIVGFCDGRDKLLMTVFVRSRLSKYLRGDLGNFGTDEDALNLPEMQKAKFQIFDLDLSTRICPDVMSGVIPGRITMTDYLKIEAPLVKANPKKTVASISIARSNLMDQDMPKIAALISDFFPACVYLDLSDNRIHGISQILRDSVDSALWSWLGSGRRVNVSGNPFATIDRRDFFQSQNTTKEMFEQLIFIPRAWLEHAGWQSMVQGRKDYNQVIDIIVQTHKQFYSFTK